jgi:hypothetical protein
MVDFSEEAEFLSEKCGEGFYSYDLGTNIYFCTHRYSQKWRLSDCPKNLLTQTLESIEK